MELVNLYIWGGIGAVFCLFVGALYGHCRRERDYAATIKYQADTHTEWRNKLVAEHVATVQALEDENMAVFELEMQLAGAYDPKQNQKAKNLYVKGVRAGAKKGREQMRKLMQKSIDNQATAITNMYETLSLSHKREDIYREAVTNTLTDKVGLVGVRRAIVQGIAAECARLRAVEAKKGE